MQGVHARSAPPGRRSRNEIPAEAACGLRTSFRGPSWSIHAPAAACGGTMYSACPLGRWVSVSHEAPPPFATRAWRPPAVPLSSSSRASRRSGMRPGRPIAKTSPPPGNAANSRPGGSFDRTTTVPELKRALRCPPVEQRSAPAATGRNESTSYGSGQADRLLGRLTASWKMGGGGGGGAANWAVVCAMT